MARKKKAKKKRIVSAETRRKIGDGVKRARIRRIKRERLENSIRAILFSLFNNFDDGQEDTIELNDVYDIELLSTRETDTHLSFEFELPWSTNSKILLCLENTFKTKFVYSDWCVIHVDSIEKSIFNLLAALQEL